MQLEAKQTGTSKLAYYLGIIGAVLTIAMAVAVVYYGEWIQARMAAIGYIGAFLISILGGSTIIIPVPMLAVVFALGGVMQYTWLVGLCSAAGELVGALIVYMTGYGGGHVLNHSSHGRLQAFYDRATDLMQRRGPLTLFILSAVINPFFYTAALTAGVLRFGIRRFTGICLLGKIIKGMTIAYLGYFGIKGLFHVIGVNI